MTGFPRTTRALREALSARGVAPRKAHGQCFLTDAQAVDAIVRDAEIEPGDHVIEVGTGTGLLTHALCEAGASVDSFDIDSRVLEVAKGLREWPERVRFHTEDALAGKHALSSALLAALAMARSAGVGRAKFVSNLPYNAATPVLLGLLSLPDPPDAITAMVQLEMGEKLLAGPGAMSAGILMAANAHGEPAKIAAVVAALAAVMLATLGLLLLAHELSRILGVTAQRVLMRVFGILLSAIAVQAVFNGIGASGLLHG